MDARPVRRPIRAGNHAEQAATQRLAHRTDIGPAGFARATAMVHVSGSNVVADVVIVTAEPNTPYDVRLIQMPRSSASSCNAGDPGVISGVLLTDGGGAGGVSLRGPVASGT